MLVVAIDTATPVVTAGVLRVLRPHELAAVMDATTGPAAAGTSAAGPPAARLPVVGPAAAGPPVVTTLAERTLTDPFGHAEHLMPLLADALAGAGAVLADAEAVVVGVGPGPFTGLRVGIATAQAIGDARGLGVYGVPSHDGVALAMGAADDQTFLVATDARRREVYVSGYQGGTRCAGPLVAAPQDIPGLLPADLAPSWICGAGAELLAPVLGVAVRAPAGPVSEGLVRAALRPLVTGAVPGPLTPLYLRRPDAAVPGAPKPVLPAGGPR